MNSPKMSAGNKSISAWHSMTPEDVLAQLGSGSDGLTVDEALRQRERFGENALPEAKRRSIGAVLGRQFASPLIYILFVAAALAFVMGERGDALVILIVVLVNALIGTFQEGRAERSMESLRRLSALRVRIIREGEERHVEAREVVPGDIMVMNAGDAVVADGRLLEAAALSVAEAALTGESLPVSKSVDAVSEETPLADRKCMIYSGTHVAAGRAMAVAVATGVETEVGKIAGLTVAAVEPKTPLENRLAQFSRYLAIAAGILFVCVVALGLARGLPLVDVLMVAISQMVSMVPEGLPVAMTIALAVGMQRMAARGAIVRRLAAVETLGSTSVICTDKTGTLTRSEMTVTNVHLPGDKLIEVKGVGYAPDGGFDVQPDARLRRLLEAAALCNDASLNGPDDKGRWSIVGDPTEAALVTLARKGGVDVGVLRESSPRLAEIPFDSDSKIMATAHKLESGGRVCIKGALESVLAICGHASVEGQVRDFDEQIRSEIEGEADHMAQRALRVLAIAEVDGGDLDERHGVIQYEGRARFLGLVGQMDPPRAEVAAAVVECLEAGVRPVMVTGDHKITGMAIARELGIAGPDDRAVDGAELERMSDVELRDGLDHIAVFARVHPAQKLRIVEAFQARSAVVAMTGDGVNDAPALARADVGVAMGITGTDVAKGAARIVLTDDNFATIVKAVEEGRLVYRNLKKVILYLFATSLAEVLVLLSALALGFPLPLAAVQILWINIVTEGTVTVNLIMEPREGDEMRRPPISSREPLLNRTMLRRVFVMTPTMAASTFGYFIWRLSTGADIAQVQTETFTVLAVCQWFNVLNCRSETGSAFDRKLFRNGWLLGGLALGNVLHFLVIYTKPLSEIFHTVPIRGRELLPHRSGGQHRALGRGDPEVLRQAAGESSSSDGASLAKTTS